MRGRLASAVAAAAVLVAGAGCGGDDDGPTLSASDFRAKANGICRGVQEANARAFKDAGRDTAALVRAGREAGARLEKAFDRLDDLEGPEADEAALDRFLDRAEDVTDAARRQADAAAKKDAAGVATAQEELGRLNDEAQRAARDAGLEACAT